MNSAQCYVAAWIGGGLGEKGYMYMYGWFLFNWNYHIVNRLHSYKIKSLKFGKRKNADNNSHSYCISNILNFRKPSSYEATSFCIFVLKMLCKSAKLAYLQSKKLTRCYCIELKSSPWMRILALINKMVTLSNKTFDSKIIVSFQNALS